MAIKSWREVLGGWLRKPKLTGDPMIWLLAVIPLALISNIMGWGALWVFFLSAIGVVPLAAFIGRATEMLAHYTGPKIGGLLNATLGNAAEMIITLVAIRSGYMELVKASITGSIIGNLLLVLGGSMLVGGLKNGIQRFDRRQASDQSVLMTLSILALVIPSFFYHAIGSEDSMKVEALSLGVAFIMIFLYILGLFYSYRSSSSPMSHEDTTVAQDPPRWTVRKSILILVAATLGVVFLSELLVQAVEGVVHQWGISEFFIGIILIPIIGNAAEHFVAIQVAYRNKMALSVEIAVSSSLQIALLVAPALVFISLAMGNPLTLIFDPFELMALGSGVLIMGLVAADGESNWLEGSAMMAVYLILGLAFFLISG